MPMLNIRTNVKMDHQAIENLIARASADVAAELGKPERYVMVALQTDQQMLFAGTDQPLAYLELKSIGLEESQTQGLSASLASIVDEHMNVPADRVYIEFSSAPRKMWGWNGSTF